MENAEESAEILCVLRGLCESYCGSGIPGLASWRTTCVPPSRPAALTLHSFETAG
jgi:hypothetical protein